MVVLGDLLGDGGGKVVESSGQLLIVVVVVIVKPENTKKKSKKTKGPDNATCIVWANLASALIVTVIASVVNPKTHLVSKKKDVKKRTKGPDDAACIIWATCPLSSELSIVVVE